MLIGPNILAHRFPKTASTWLTRELKAAGLITGELEPGQPTHRGLWSAEEHIPGRLVLGGIRDPWTWHLSYYHHHLMRDGTPGSRLTEWWPDFGGLPEGLLIHPKIVAAMLIQKHADPVGACSLDLDWLPRDWAWALPPDDEPPRRWMAERGCGLMTWAYVRAYYPRRCWGWSVGELLERPSQRYPVWFIHKRSAAARVQHAIQERGLSGYVVNPTPTNDSATRNAPAKRWSGVVRDYLSQELIDLVGERERLVVELHGYVAP